jgi:methylmalonyl-CoA/ethylmalonyl-CoA epimerase
MSEAAGNGPGIRRIGQLAVNVQDVGRATAFYRDVLGLRHLFEAGGMSFFDCGGVRLLLGVPEPGEHDHQSSLVYFDVESIDAAHALLQERGVQVERAPAQVADLGDRTLWLAFFRDSEGNMLALMSEVQKAG